MHVNIHVIADGLDYQLLQASLQFSGGNQRSCINIELLNDLTTEGVETFTILLNTEEDRITLTSDSAAITIIDINSEYNNILPVQ